MTAAAGCLLACLLLLQGAAAAAGCGVGCPALPPSCSFIRCCCHVDKVLLLLLKLLMTTTMTMITMTLPLPLMMMTTLELQHLATSAWGVQLQRL